MLTNVEQSYIGQSLWSESFLKVIHTNNWILELMYKTSYIPGISIQTNIGKPELSIFSFFSSLPPSQTLLQIIIPFL